MTRAEHLAWCKKRAMEYVDRGNILDGVTSMLSDLNKHPETKLPDDSPLRMLGLMAAMNNNLNEAKRFIVGFN